MSDFNYEGLRKVIYEATGEDWDTAGQIAKLGGDAFLADNELYAINISHPDLEAFEPTTLSAIERGVLRRAGGSDADWFWWFRC